MPIKLGRQDSKQVREKLKDEARQIIALARDCLADDKFKRYRDMALQHREKLLQALMGYEEDDPIKYAFEVRLLLNTLGLSNQLLKDIEAEAKMEIKEEKKDAGGNEGK